MSGILQCFYELCGFVSDKQSNGAVKVVQNHQKIHRGEEQKQPLTNENQYLLDGNITAKPIKENNRDSISMEGQTEVEPKLGPSSDSDYKTSESPVHTDDAKPEVPSLLTVQQDEVRYCLLPPAYEVRREGNVFTGVCLFTGGGGGEDAPVSGSRFLPCPWSQVLSGGYPSLWSQVFTPGWREYLSQVLGQGYLSEDQAGEGGTPVRP